ncbi:1-acyl-sn-glycerol-3-phosphate acyltransferase [Thalassovita sp.]|uniref:1-acyl-sn-glycerol-3-phosphate acyltransferase n=1 Tax=Thalassovita sp. TaxID=1979401 RepID=UPI002B2775DD|nr:1-acyl-sn-glycerol-3-phosphate acyltransferase [Thalassovita sp.]
MTTTVEMPLWVLALLIAFAAVTFASHFLFPSVRWFFRKRMERLVARLNTRLTRPIEPFKLARRYDMIQRLIYDPEIGQAITDYAASEGIPENVAFERARRYAGEIVPAFSVWTYFSFAARVARWLCRSFYQVRVINFDGERIEQLDTEATVVLVMNHRSNMDYVLLTHLAAPRGALSYAVGEWARVWPLSRLIRALGAYFIRRRDGDLLYREILAKYVYLATRAGVTQAVFPEGRLSLTGRLADPKLGILKYIVDARDPDGRDVIFVPVALNYDHVLEDCTLLAAAEKSQRRFRVSLRSVFLGVLKVIWIGQSGRRRRYGHAGVCFGKPLPLAGFDGDVQALADEMMRRISAAMPVLPVPVLAYLLLSQGATDRVTLELQMKKLLLESNHSAVYWPRNHAGLALEQAITLLEQRNLIRLDGDKVVPIEREKPLLRFYAASVEHIFAHAASTA